MVSSAGGDGASVNMVALRIRVNAFMSAISNSRSSYLCLFEQQSLSPVALNEQNYEKNNSLCW